MEIKQNISLKPYNTFGIDQKADFFAEIKTVENLKEIFSNSGFSEMPKLILGGGSNVLFTQPYEGLVLKMNLLGIEVAKEDENEVILKVGAGENWHEFVLWCLDKGYGGIENLSLIPGTVGAAPIQNIGAYGVEIKDVLEYVEVFEIATGDVFTIENQDCNFGYRQSIFKSTHKGKYVVTSVAFKLQKNPTLNLSYGNIQQTLEEIGISNPTMKDVSNAVISIRQSKLPDPAQIGNSGSFFKNPIIPQSKFDKLKEVYPDIKSYSLPNEQVKVPAAWLIEQAGWKGYKSGEIGVHHKQPLVLVNYGKGKGSDIYQLSEEIIQSVSEKYDVILEREVNVI